MAVKKALVKISCKDHEIDMIKKLNGHPCIVRTLNYYFAKAEDPGFCTLNLIMNYYPETLIKYFSSFLSAGKPLPQFEYKLLAYQILRGIAYMHAHNIVYCDMKPQNILMNRKTLECVLCDFGACQYLSAKPRCAYVCSRYYRAPELMFGNKFYGPAIDLWSCGCVFAEMLIGRPLFVGASPIEQLVEIIKVMGPPTVSELWELNPNINKLPFPPTPADGLNSAVNNEAVKINPATGEKTVELKDPMLSQLITGLLTYSPRHRLTAFNALMLPFFDEIRAHTEIGEDGLETYFWK